MEKETWNVFRNLSSEMHIRLVRRTNQRPQDRNFGSIIPLKRSASIYLAMLKVEMDIKNFKISE
jgi:hypothetical protein